LSFKITRLVVAKGKTVGDEKAGTWTREYYELEAQIQDERDLSQAKAALEGLVDIWLSGEAAPKQQPSPSIEDSSHLFPEPLRNLLSFERKDDAIIVKPRQFLGSENFARIAEIVKQQGGDYISAGKGSHFKIPKKA
jgi:hypothetical protein